MYIINGRAYPRRLSYHYMTFLCSTSLPPCRGSQRLYVQARQLKAASALVTTIILRLLGIIGAVGVVLIVATVTLIVHIFGVLLGLVVSTLTVVGVHTC